MFKSPLNHSFDNKIYSQNYMQGISTKQSDSSIYPPMQHSPTHVTNLPNQVITRPHPTTDAHNRGSASSRSPRFQTPTNPHSSRRRNQSTHKRLLHPKRKRLLLNPILTLLAQSHIKLQHNSRQNQSHLMHSHALSETIPRSPCKRLVRFRDIVVVSHLLAFAVDPALGNEGVAVLEIRFGVVG